MAASLAPLRGTLVRGKSGLPEAKVPGNARAEQSDGKRHRKQTSMHVVERVKRWGKSPPGLWQQGPHGKPHPGAMPNRDRNMGRFTPAVRVGSLSLCASTGLEEWSSKLGVTPAAQNPAYRLSAHFLLKPKSVQDGCLGRGRSLRREFFGQDEQGSGGCFLSAFRRRRCAGVQWRPTPTDLYRPLVYGAPGGGRRCAGLGPHRRIWDRMRHSKGV